MFIFTTSVSSYENEDHHLSDKIATLPLQLIVLQKQFEVIYSGHTPVIISSFLWQAPEMIKPKITRDACGSSNVPKVFISMLQRL